MTNWYAIRTPTRSERQVGAALSEQFYPVFLPMATDWCVEPGRAKERRSEPLFPGYVFVLCEPEDFHQILSVEGVQGFVRYIREDGVAWPYPFSAREVLGLQIEERAGTFDNTVQVRYRPRKGERVTITAGPYFNHTAKVLETPRGQRAQLLVEGFEPRRHRTEDIAHLAAA